MGFPPNQKLLTFLISRGGIISIFTKTNISKMQYTGNKSQTVSLILITDTNNIHGFLIGQMNVNQS